MIIRLLNMLNFSLKDVVVLVFDMCFTFLDLKIFEDQLTSVTVYIHTTSVSSI